METVINFTNFLKVILTWDLKSKVEVTRAWQRWDLGKEGPPGRGYSIGKSPIAGGITM